MGQANLSENEINGGFCLLFIKHIKGAAHEWFLRLDHNSIDSFDQLYATFLKYYSMYMDRETSDADLWTLSQGPAESLRSFIEIFKVVISKVDRVSDKTALTALRKSQW